jgi:hypothetical protein
VTPEEQRVVGHAISACRVAAGILARQEVELETVRRWMETWQADLARLLNPTDQPAAS